MSKLPTESSSPTAKSTPTNQRWEGHMSDGVGSTYGPAPMAHLAAEAGHLVLSGSRGNFYVPRAAVVRLGRGGFYPWFFGGIRIHHSVAGFPTELVFKPMGIRERDILARLREMGYPVA